MKILLMLFAFPLLLTGRAYGHENIVPQEVGLEEKIGQTLPPDAVFFDEQGARVTLRQLVDRPVVLSLVYYSCDHLCPQLLAALAEVIGKSSSGAGKDFTVLTISFDPGDTPRDALTTRENFIKSLNGKIPGNSWKFLTGDKAAIKKITDAAGFKFKGERLHGFSHPVALIVLSPDSRIMRYIYATNYAYGAPKRISFLPSDFSMAVAEASMGRPGMSNRSDISYCFPYESKGQGAFFNVLKIMGVVIILSLAGFFIYLNVSNSKARKGNGAGE